MLSRLADLRNLAQGSSPDVDDPGKKKDELADDEYAERLAEMQAQYKEILEDEGVTTQAFEEVRLRVESMEELVQLQKEALLPSRLQQLANRFEGQELTCQRMIRRAKEALVALRAEDADVDEDDIVHISLTPIRNNIARVRGKQFKDLVQGFFTARAHNREEMLIRATRQLRYAYPDALDEELNDILEFPELAAVAIAQRLEKGADGVTLDGILAEMEGKKADAKKLEQGAKELKLMFLQFAELIDNQGENLTAIESNIKTVIEETTEAIGNLLDAEAEKRAYERKWMKFYIIIFLLVVYFILWPVYKALFGKDPNYRRQQQSWGSYIYNGFSSAERYTEREFEREERAFEREFAATRPRSRGGGEGGGDDGGDLGGDRGGGRGGQSSGKGNEGTGIGHNLMNAVSSIGGAAKSAADGAYNLIAHGAQSVGGGNKKKGRGDDESSSLVQVETRSEMKEIVAHERLNDTVIAEIRKSAGFIAPRPRPQEAEGESASDPAYQRLAVTARGGATRQSALRKQNLSPRD